MFGSNGPCSPTDYMSQYSNILEPIYYPTSSEVFPQNQLFSFDSDPDCHSSAPPTPDVISGLISLTSGPSPSEMSCGSFGDITSPEDYNSASSPPYPSVDISAVKATRTKLIKEGLKLTIQSRRMVHGLDNVRPEYRHPPKEELTKEDEDRRRRRRERNKVAATKCRNKKKERTGRLAEESESLEVNNNALKNEIHSLEVEKQELMGLLQNHLPHCAKQRPPPTARSYCSLPNQVVHNQMPSWSSVSG
ncbi:cyclic AMP-dependent transcription factor ATF-3 [Parasteatoda tepidariorum]|uniref:cyclic AMP-dependent transcription factor ATF-3 n=1 Tax=Parasteatoda tepidariorum TaxID=114398 RepID=UPI00077F8E79|nr:cyclic AMP-dependent transcription factor ATF-3 [Parasteatoda tepidariorum]XP_015927977.1 cyclic AMP-dependent transcription factor ATF-3 [Parasteatoda tepidariorum]XP_015927981.1 cyclic AMP-dependent transcription factor ATF-3 [Parasteatoda tepidariorum]